MSVALVKGGAAWQRLGLMECSPCTVALALKKQLRRAAWCKESTALCTAAATGAILLGGATEVLVPSSLVSFMEAARLHAASGGASHSRLSEWETLVEEQRVIVLVDDGAVERFVTQYPQFHRLCVPVPSGPLVSKLVFRDGVDVFYDERVKRVASVVAAAGPKVQWQAWMRSALTCPYEGVYVPPIRVADLTARLLRGEGGCTSVVWEAAVAGLAPRWLETLLKTALACGVPTATLSLSLCNEGTAPALLSKAVDFGVTRMSTNALGTLPMWEGCGSPLPPSALICFAAGWSDVQGHLSDADEELLETSVAFREALHASWQDLLKRG